MMNKIPMGFLIIYTEGVWMALTPTDDALIVALDFEGAMVL